MVNNKPNDKVITVEQINFMLKHLVELKFRESNPIIQTLMSLENVNKVNNSNKQESK